MRPVSILYRDTVKNFLYAVLRRMICPFNEMRSYLKNRRYIADIGCGHGLFSVYLAQHNPSSTVFGFDPNLTRLQSGYAAGKRMNNLHFICGQFITKHSFDGICLSDVFHHLNSEDQTSLLAKIFESLVPGGVLVVKEICTNDGIQYLLSALSDRILYPDDNLLFRSSTEWIRLLEVSGFTVKHKHIWYTPFSTNLFIAHKRD